MTNMPSQIANWITEQGWSLHAHQIEMFEQAHMPVQLLVAPTGAGKTLAGFLPTLADLAEAPHTGIHTIYVSPLKALAADMKRNLLRPVEEIGISARIEDRTGDTSAHIKRRQRVDPPDILLTTPESLALMVSYPEAPTIFHGVKRIIIDEIHALAESKRGDQLMLALSRIAGFAPQMRRVGLSATIENPAHMAAYLGGANATPHIVLADPGPAPNITMLRSETPPPWAGAGAAYAINDVLDLIRDHQTSLIFHNTRAQAEIFFHNLWLANEEGLPIGIHHGSLDRVQREKVEAAMVANQLRAVVCTGSLDLGIDWGNVDLVIQIGAPKNVKRLVQRIGRANHRYNAPSKAVIVPANRFEVIECQAALDALNDNDLDGDSMRRGALDVLCQHILICACQAPFDADALFEQIRTTDLYKSLTRAVFDKCLDFCASGGYALRAYDEWHRLIARPEGTFALRDPRAAAKIRMNIGTIQDTDTLKVRLKKTRGGKPLGEVEESFAATLRQGETFLIGGQIVRFEGLRDMVVEVTRRADKTPRVAVFSGTKFATSLQLSHRVMQILSEENWQSLPDYVQDWLALQKHFSRLPHPDRLLIEGFPRREMEHTVIYGFAGRNAQQTLGLLVTKRMEDMGLDPLGFVATDYATMIWGLEQIQNPEQLLNAANLRDDLQNWLTQNAVMKRTFREVAHISGLIQRNGAGQRKSGRQVTFSSDILFDTLIKYDPDHLLLDITRQEAMSGLIDFARLEHMLTRIQNRIDLVRLSHVSPLAAPLLLEVGRVPIKGEAEEKLMARETETLMREAGLA